MTLEIGEYYKVIPVKFEPFGAIVKLEDDSTCLIHISQISDSYVEDPSYFMNIGDMYVAKAIKGVNGRYAQLSVKYLKLPSQVKEHSSTSYHRKDTTNNRNNHARHNPARIQTMSLDEMIQRANADYSDKMQGKNKKHKRR